MRIRARLPRGRGWLAEEARRRPRSPTIPGRAGCESPRRDRERLPPVASIPTPHRTPSSTWVSHIPCLVWISAGQGVAERPVDTRSSKEPAQGPGAALAARPLRRVRPAGFPRRRQAPMGPPCSPHCPRRLHRPRAPWMKATCRMGRNAMKRRWCSPSPHLPPTSEYAAASPRLLQHLLQPLGLQMHVLHLQLLQWVAARPSTRTWPVQRCFDHWCHESNLAPALGGPRSRVRPDLRAI